MLAEKHLMRPVLVWDFPVRLFHIFLIAGFGGAYSIARFGGEHHPAFWLHMVFGLTIAVLVVARLVWGFVGTRWARWSTMVHGPAAFADYAKHVFRKGGRHFTGHNPFSVLGIVAMLCLTLALAFTGFSITQGNEAFEDIHPVLANLFLAVVGAHIAGVLIHQVVHGGRLVLGMVDGKKVAPEEHAIASDAPVGGLVFLALAAWIGGGMVVSRDPTTNTTRVPGLPLAVRLGESEEEAVEEDDRHGREAAKSARTQSRRTKQEHDKEDDD